MNDNIERSLSYMFDLTEKKINKLLASKTMHILRQRFVEALGYSCKKRRTILSFLSRTYVCPFRY